MKRRYAGPIVIASENLCNGKYGGLKIPIYEFSSRNFNSDIFTILLYVKFSHVGTYVINLRDFQNIALCEVHSCWYVCDKYKKVSKLSRDEKNGKK